MQELNTRGKGGMQERRKLEVNENESKNTRLNIVGALSACDFRKDVFVHTGRYLKACETIIKLGDKLGRPLRILDIGCGSVYTVRTFYKAFQKKKSDYIEKYIGVDIDNYAIDKVKEECPNILELCNVSLKIQDLTVNPKIKVKDGYFDLVIWFEVIEHMKPEFVAPIFKELYRVVNPEGIVLVSTPNADGSAEKLPADHIHEWGYTQLKSVMSNNFIIQDHVGLCVNLVKAKEHAKQNPKVRTLYQQFEKAFDKTYLSIMLAPFVPPEDTKNILWTLVKEEG